MAERITKMAAAMKIITHNSGTIFTVTFIKRTDGKKRVMNCRKGVTKYKTGGKLNYDPKKKGLISVYDMQSQGYRMIALENIKRIAIKGTEYIVS